MKTKQKRKRDMKGHKKGEITVSFRVSYEDRAELTRYVRKKLEAMNYKLNNIRSWE